METEVSNRSLFTSTSKKSLAGLSITALEGVRLQFCNSLMTKELMKDRMEKGIKRIQYIDSLHPGLIDCNVN